MYLILMHTDIYLFHFETSLKALVSKKFFNKLAESKQSKLNHDICYSVNETTEESRNLNIH